MGIALFGEPEPQMVFERAAGGLASLRLVRAGADPMRGFGHHYHVPIGACDEIDVEIFVDNGLVELSAGAGQVWAINLHFPDEPAGRVTLSPRAVARGA